LTVILKIRNENFLFSVAVSTKSACSYIPKEYIKLRTSAHIGSIESHKRVSSHELQRKRIIISPAKSQFGD